MRRKDKAIQSRETMEALIQQARVCRLALTGADGPYVVPLCFGYRDNTFFFHCAKAGRKLELLRGDSRVCIEIDCMECVHEAEQACKWGMRYQSVLAFGRAELIEAPEARRRALNIIMQHYSGRAAWIYSEAELERTALFQVAVEAMTGKQSV